MTVSRRHLAAALAASGASALAVSSGALAQTSDATAVAEAVAAYLAQNQR